MLSKGKELVMVAIGPINNDDDRKTVQGNKGAGAPPQEETTWKGPLGNGNVPVGKTEKEVENPPTNKVNQVLKYKGKRPNQAGEMMYRGKAPEELLGEITYKTGLIPEILSKLPESERDAFKANPGKYLKEHRLQFEVSELANVFMPLAKCKTPEEFEP